MILFIGCSSPTTQNNNFPDILSGEVNGKGCAIGYAGGNPQTQNRTLNSITVEGSDDNSTWTTIGSTDQKTIYQSNNSSTKIFNDAAYKYYRVKGVASNMGSAAATLVVFG